MSGISKYPAGVGLFVCLFSLQKGAVWVVIKAFSSASTESHHYGPSITTNGAINVWVDIKITSVVWCLVLLLLFVRVFIVWLFSTPETMSTHTQHPNKHWTPKSIIVGKQGQCFNILMVTLVLYLY